MGGLKVIVTGGRSFPALRRHEIGHAIVRMTHLFGKGRNDLTIVHGACATGVDAFADEWAKLQISLKHNVKIKTYPANWDMYGKRAGHMRNAAMVEAHQDADIALAFWNGTTKGSGTWNCIQALHKFKVNTHVVWY